MSEKIYGRDDNKNLVQVYSKEEVDKNIGHLKSKDFISTPLIASKYLGDTNTGKLIIKLPHRKDSSKQPMIKLTIELINKYGNDYAEYVVSAQLLKGVWTSNKTMISNNGKGDLSNSPISVGVEDEYYAITIGEDTTVWNYLQVNIKDVSVWFYEPKFEDWNKDWDILIGIPTGIYTVMNKSPNQLINVQNDLEPFITGVIDEEIYADKLTNVNSRVKSIGFFGKKIGNFIYIQGEFDLNEEMPNNSYIVVCKIPEKLRPRTITTALSTYYLCGEKTTGNFTMKLNDNGSIILRSNKTVNLGSNTIYFNAMYMAF